MSAAGMNRLIYSLVAMMASTASLSESISLHLQSNVSAVAPAPIRTARCLAHETSLLGRIMKSFDVRNTICGTVSRLRKLERMKKGDTVCRGRGEGGGPHLHCCWQG